MLFRSEMIALRRLSTKTYGLLMSVEPAVAALAGLALLGERLATRQWIGIVFVMIASVGTLGDDPAVSDQMP